MSITAGIAYCSQVRTLSLVHCSFFLSQCGDIKSHNTFCGERMAQALVQSHYCHPGLVLDLGKVWACRRHSHERLSCSKQNLCTRTLLPTGQAFVSARVSTCGTAGSSDPQRCQISLSVPSRLNYFQRFEYKTNVIPVLVVIIHRVVQVALRRCTCFDLHYMK